MIQRDLRNHQGEDPPENHQAIKDPRDPLNIPPGKGKAPRDSTTAQDPGYTLHHQRTDQDSPIFDPGQDTPHAVDLHLTEHPGTAQKPGYGCTGKSPASYLLAAYLRPAGRPLDSILPGPKSTRHLRPGARSPRGKHSQ